MASVTNFFLGANGGDGFQSLFDRLAGEHTYDLMILKGGPGVGKSTFLSSVGEAMEEVGERVEYLRCSGNPDSLDGLVLPDMACAAVDGTAPHTLEPNYPAAVDRIVDLGRFYDLMAAKASRDEIVALIQKHRQANDRAYRCLKAARQVELETVAAGQKAFDFQRADRRLDGIIARELRKKGGEPGRTDYRFLGGITCRGTVWRFDSVDALCTRVYELTDRWELAGPLLERLRKTAADRGWNVIACPSPEEPARLEHLLIPGLELGFVTSRPGMEYGKKPTRRIRLDALTHTEEQGRERLLRRMAASLREEAVSALWDAKIAHDALEAVYNPYVDFDGVRALAAIETGRLLSWRDRR
ncbi:hypothetical protein OBV_21010 [Oscillibacter valericigenes Sjm18-20]|nr:hypothetical protein OBV_21010 [Oscillibacter valericigenes Sjm18-20]